MQDFMKENWFKVGLVIILSIAGISMAHYYLVFLPEKENQDFLFSMKQKCQDSGTKLYEEDFKEMGRSALFTPEYAYNQKLNTCLYASGYIQSNSLQKWIKDVHSNKEIVLFMNVDGKILINDKICDICVSNEEFEKQKQELFK